MTTTRQHAHTAVCWDLDGTLLSADRARVAADESVGPRLMAAIAVTWAGRENELDGVATGPRAPGELAEAGADVVLDDLTDPTPLVAAVRDASQDGTSHHPRGV